MKCLFPKLKLFVFRKQVVPKSNRVSPLIKFNRLFIAQNQLVLFHQYDKSLLK